MKRQGLTFALAALLAGCGNYSNEDIEFQVALPERDDLEAKLPGQALVVDDAAEYYRTTRSLVGVSNGIKDAVLGLVDHVRMYPATTRRPGLRIWGPFPHDRQRDWMVRISILRVNDRGSPLRFNYSFDLRRRDAAADAPWIRLMWGWFQPEVRRRFGELHIQTAEARAAGHVIDDPADPDDLNDLDTLRLAYETHTFPVVLDMTATNIATAARPAGAATFSYREQSDGSGSATFGFDVAAAPWAERVELQTRWVASGAGRGDARVTKGLLSGDAGTDCWDRDTRATYVRRVVADAKQPNRGDPASCVLPAP